MAESVENYIVQLIMATRHSEPYLQHKPMEQMVAFGASPRGTLALDRCARAHALLMGRDYVTQDDVRAIVHNVLRHRLIPTYEAEAMGLTSDAIIDKLLAKVPVV